MATADLTTLAAVKTYLGITDSTSDTELTALITQVSAAIRTDTSRDLVPVTQYTAILNGHDKNVVFLKNYPIISVASVNIDGNSIPVMPEASNSPGRGYAFDDDNVELRGYIFRKGMKNVKIVYTAGFAVNAEAATIPATPFQVQSQNPYGNFNSDIGVTYAATGVAFTKVASGPSVGQYSVSASGLYTFNIADENQNILISYGYVPADLERSCIEWVGLRQKQKASLGVDSKGIAGETVRYTKEAMPDSVLGTLQQYRRVLPIWN